MALVLGRPIIWAASRGRHLRLLHVQGDVDYYSLYLVEVASAKDEVPKVLVATSWGAWIRPFASVVRRLGALIASTRRDPLAVFFLVLAIVYALLSSPDARFGRTRRHLPEPRD